jgi:hypothetical protein
MTTSQILIILCGFAAALIAAVAVGMITSCGYGLFRILAARGATTPDLYGAFIFLALNAAYMSAKVAFPTIIIAAAPYVWLSLRLHRTSLGHYVVSGALIGLGAAAVMTAWRYLSPMPPFRMDPDAYFTAVSAILAGAIAALTFWQVARPDRMRHQAPAGQ